MRTVKTRDPSWRVRHAKGHKVERDKTKYTRKIRNKKDPRRISDGGKFLRLLAGCYLWRTSFSFEPRLDPNSNWKASDSILKRYPSAMLKIARISGLIVDASKII